MGSSKLHLEILNNRINSPYLHQIPRQQHRLQQHLEIASKTILVPQELCQFLFHQYYIFELNF